MDLAERKIRRAATRGDVVLAAAVVAWVVAYAVVTNLVLRGGSPG